MKSKMKTKVVFAMVLGISFGIAIWIGLTGLADTWIQQSWLGQGSSTINVSGDELKLIEQVHTDGTVDSSEADFKDNLGITNAEIINIGDLDGAVKLDPAITDSFVNNDPHLTPDLGRWLTLPSIPSPGKYSTYTRMGDYLYCTFASGDGRQFGRFHILNEEWEFLEPVPTPLAAGSTMTNDGQYIYVLRGSGATNSFFYLPPEGYVSFLEPASGSFGTLDLPLAGQWSDFEPFSSDIGLGSDIVSVGGPVSQGGKLYALKGAGGDGKGFYVYNENLSKWWQSDFAFLASVEQGGALVYTGGDYIYGVRGQHTKSFYAYEIGGSSGWINKQDIPINSTYSSQGFWRGSDIWYPGSGDYIYAAGMYRSGESELATYTTRRGFARYGPLTNGNPTAASDWETLPNIPTQTYESRFIIYDPYKGVAQEGQELHFFSGRNYTKPWKYDLTTGRAGANGVKGQWKTLVQAPIDNSYGINLVYCPDNDYLYYVPAYGANTFFRYSIQYNDWEQIANAPGTIASSGNRLTYLDGYIYCLLGNVQDGFYRYDITQGAPGSWETLTDFPEHPNQDIIDQEYRPSYGSGVIGVTVGSDKYIYARRGRYMIGNIAYGSNDFYRYGPLNGVDSDLTLDWDSMDDFIHYIGNYGGFMQYVDYDYDSGPGKKTYIYANPGRNQRNFYRYGPIEEDEDVDVDLIDGDGITTGKWEEVLAVPSSLYFYWHYFYGNSFGYPGPGADSLYASPGTNDTNGYAYRFLRYDLATDNWTPLSPFPFAAAFSCIAATPSKLFIVNYYGHNNFWSYDYAADTWSDPVTNAHGDELGNMVVDGEDNIYMFFGEDDSDLPSHVWVYKPSVKRWTDILKVPFPIAPGTAAEYLPINNSIYCTEGRGSDDIYRYELDTKTWLLDGDGKSPLSSGGGPFYRGTQLTNDGTYLYATTGSGRVFKRYRLETSTTPYNDGWQDLALLSANHSNRINGLEYAKIGNDTGKIYFLPGDNEEDFYVWEMPTLISEPGEWKKQGLVGDTDGLGLSGFPTYYGGSLSYPGRGDYIYCIPKGLLANIFRLDISIDNNKTWQALKNLPIDIAENATSIVATSDEPWLYVYNQKWGSYLMRYYPLDDNTPADSKDIWDVPTYLPESMDAYSAFCGYKGKTYFLSNGGFFYQYDVNTDEWSSLTGPDTTPYHNSNLTSVEYAGKAYIFYNRGNNSDIFYKYSIADDTWDKTIARPKSNFEYGNSLAYFEDTRIGRVTTGAWIYVLRGESYSFWRYSVATDEWDYTSLPDSEKYISYGAEMVYCPVGGNYLYVLAGNYTRDFKCFDLDNMNWDRSVDNCPLAINNSQSRLIYPGFGDYLYLLHGSARWDRHPSYAFLKYSVRKTGETTDANTWQELTPSSLAIQSPGTLIWPGTGEYMFATDGGGRELSKYYAFCFGDYTSSIKEVGNHSSWGRMVWEYQDDAGSTIAAVRSGNDSGLSDAIDWSLIPSVTNQTTITSANLTDKYVQYRLSFATDDLDAIPIVKTATIEWKRYPAYEQLLSTVENSDYERNRLTNISWDQNASGTGTGADLRLQLRTRLASQSWASDDDGWLGPDGNITYEYNFNQTTADDYAIAPEIKMNLTNVSLYKDLENFAYSQEVVIDNSSGGERTKAIYGLVIPESFTHFWDTVRDDGADMRFYEVISGNAVKLDYYLAEFDYNGKAVNVNIEIPFVAAGTVKEIYLAYGAPDAQSQSNISLWYDPPSQDLLAAWHFDENGGETLNDAIGSANGTLYNYPQWVNGKLGTALEFDGLNDYVKIPYPSVFRRNTPFTWSVWMKPTKPITSHTYFMNYCWFVPYGWAAQGNNRIRFRFKTGTTGDYTYHERYTSHGVITPFEWNHLILSYDGEYGRVYVNGVEKGNILVDGTLIIENRNVYFGSEYGRYYSYKGLLDEALYYGRAIDDAEIKCLATGFSTDNDDIYIPIGQETGDSLALLGWLYKRPLEVNNSGASNIGNEVIRLTIDDSFSGFWQNIAADPDGVGPERAGNDIRFLDQDNYTSLDYYLELIDTVAKTAVVWVKIRNDSPVPAGSSKIIYLYHGGPGLLSGSNKSIVEVFPVYEFDNSEPLIDKFDLSGNVVGFTLPDGHLMIEGFNDWTTYLTSKDTYDRANNLSFKAKIKIPLFTELAIGWKDTSSEVSYTSMPDALYFNPFSWYGYDLTQVSVSENGSLKPASTQWLQTGSSEWRTIRIDLLTEGANYYIDDTDNPGQWILLWSGTIAGGPITTSLKLHIVQNTQGQITLSDDWEVVKVMPAELSVSMVSDFQANEYDTGGYYTNRPVIQPILGVMYDTTNDLISFAETATKEDSEIKYQFSADGYHWYYYNSAWVEVTEGYNQANKASDITNAVLNLFESQVADAGDFYYRAYFATTGGTPELERINIEIRGNPSFYVVYEGTNISGLSPFAHTHTDSVDDQIMQYKISFYSDGENTPILDNLNLEHTDAWVRVTSPNTGTEIWPAGVLGEQYKITWDWFGIDENTETVRVEYNLNHGDGWELALDRDGVSANAVDIGDGGQGSFEWRVPSVATQEAQVRVISNDFTVITDTSDNYFTVESLRFAYPDGGEIWEMEENKNIVISAAASGYRGALDLKFSLTGIDGFWQSIADAVPVVVDDVSRMFALLADKGAAPSNTVYLRASDSNTGMVLVISNLLYIVPKPEITIIEPVADIQFEVGKSYLIRWMTNQTQFSDQVILEYYDSASPDAVYPIITMDTSGGFPFPGTIPPNQPLSNSYIWDADDRPGNFVLRIKEVSAPVGRDTVIEVEKEVNFSIVAPFIELTRPVGDEGWVVGDTEEISWITIGEILNDTLLLTYSTDGGATTLPAQSGLTLSNTFGDSDTGGGSYDWVIPAEAEGKSIILQINSSKYADTIDTSESFDIYGSNIVELLNPVDGEHITMGTSYEITGKVYGNEIKNGGLFYLFKSIDGVWDPIDLGYPVGSISFDGGQDTAVGLWSFVTPLSEQVQLKAVRYISDPAPGYFDIGVTAVSGEFIIEKPEVNIVSPVATDQWYATGYYDIIWKEKGSVGAKPSADDYGKLKFEVDYNDGSGFVDFVSSWPNSEIFIDRVGISEGTTAPLSSSRMLLDGYLWQDVGGDYHYVWKVEDKIDALPRIRITDIGNPIAWDISDVSEAFTIISPTITIDVPVEGKMREPLTISWTSSGSDPVIGAVSDDLSIEYYDGSWQYVLDGSNPVDALQLANGSFDWVIPTTAERTNAAKIRMTDNGRVATTNESAEFTISVPQITVARPNNSLEVWVMGTEHEILWKADPGISENILIQYAPDGVSFNPPVGEIVASYTTLSPPVSKTYEANEFIEAGEYYYYNWTVPIDAGAASNINSAKIKITDTLGGAEAWPELIRPTDASDSNFIISLTRFQVSEPHSGELLALGDNKDIVWAVEGELVGDGVAGPSEDMLVEFTTHPQGSFEDPSYVHEITRVSQEAFEFEDGDRKTYKFSWFVGMDIVSDEFMGENAVVRITDTGRIIGIPPNEQYIAPGKSAAFKVLERPEIYVFEPAGGAEVIMGTQALIKWNHNNGPVAGLIFDYKLPPLQAGDPDRWKPVSELEQPDENLAGLSWTVPSVDPDTGAIFQDAFATELRATDYYRNPANEGLSAVFTVIVPQIEITSPQGDPDMTIWATGDLATINFTPIGDVDLDEFSLIFEYTPNYTASPAQWYSFFPEYITKVDDTEYTWQVENEALGSNAKISIKDGTRPNTIGYSDRFRVIATPQITNVAITSIVGNFPDCIIGDAIRIDWETEGINFEGFNLEYANDGSGGVPVFGVSTKNLNEDVLSNDTRTYTWTIDGAGILTGDTIGLRVVAVRGDVQEKAYDTSFGIQGGFRFDGSEAAPRENDEWTTNEMRTVRWQTKGLIEEVNLYCSYQSGTPGTWGEPLNINGPIDNTVVDGEGYNYFEWKVPNERTDKSEAEPGENPRTGENSNTVIIKIVQVNPNTGEEMVEVTNQSEPFEIGWYDITWQVLDYDSLVHLSGLIVKDAPRPEYNYPGWYVPEGDPDVDLERLESPTLTRHEYPYGTYASSWEKDEYQPGGFEFDADSDKTITIYMESNISAQIEWHTITTNSYTASSDVIQLQAWLERRGKLQGLTEIEYERHRGCELVVYDEGEATPITTFTKDKPNQHNGVYEFTWANVRDYLEPGKTYFMKSTIRYGVSEESPNIVTSGGIIDITIAAEQYEQEQQLDTIEDKVDLTIVTMQEETEEIKDKVDDATDLIEGKIDDARESVEGKIAEVKSETAEILIATEETIPEAIIESREIMESIIKSEILNRESSAKRNTTLVIRYRTYAGVTPTIDVYDSSNVLRINKGIMSALLATIDGKIAIDSTAEEVAVYEYSVTFDSRWSLGDFTIVCSEPTYGTMDAITITVMRSDIDSLAGQVSAVLGSTSKINDVKDAMQSLTAQFGMVERALQNMGSQMTSGTISDQQAQGRLEAVYSNLVTMSGQIKQLGASSDINLEKLYSVSKDKAKDLKYLKNKTQELKAVMDLNQKLIQGIANKQPVSETWYEYK